jgi:hypothetical protein
MLAAGGDGDDAVAETGAGADDGGQRDGEPTRPSLSIDPEAPPPALALAPVIARTPTAAAAALPPLPARPRDGALDAVIRGAAAQAAREWAQKERRLRGRGVTGAQEPYGVGAAGNSLYSRNSLYAKRSGLRSGSAGAETQSDSDSSALGLDVTGQDEAGALPQLSPRVKRPSHAQIRSFLLAEVPKVYRMYARNPQPAFAVADVFSPEDFALLLRDYEDARYGTRRGTRPRDGPPCSSTPLSRLQTTVAAVLAQLARSHRTLGALFSAHAQQQEQQQQQLQGQGRLQSSGSPASPRLRPPRRPSLSLRARLRLLLMQPQSQALLAVLLPVSMRGAPLTAALALDTHRGLLGDGRGDGEAQEAQDARRSFVSAPLPPTLAVIAAAAHTQADIMPPFHEAAGAAIEAQRAQMVQAYVKGIRTMYALCRHELRGYDALIQSKEDSFSASLGEQLRKVEHDVSQAEAELREETLLHVRNLVGISKFRAVALHIVALNRLMKARRKLYAALARRHRI